MERTRETWSQIDVSAQLLATAGEHVVMAVDIQSIGHDSGVPVHQRVFWVYTLRGGRVATSIAYPGEAEALEAAGLRD
jgi:ketosteroid isomerase-like protein